MQDQALLGMKSLLDLTRVKPLSMLSASFCKRCMRWRAASTSWPPRLAVAEIGTKRDCNYTQLCGKSRLLCYINATHSCKNRSMCRQKRTGLCSKSITLDGSQQRTFWHMAGRE